MHQSTLRALGCVRVSTARQAEHGYSIPEQRASIEACCGRHGLQLLDVLVDDGVSGKILERPAIRKITEPAEAGAFDVLVLVKLNRLGRENAVIQQLLARFRDRGIRVLFVEHGSGDTKEERLQLGILSAFAEFEWDTLREATMSGRERKAKQGKIPINCPLFGYHCVTKAEATVKPELAGRDGELLVIEEEAKWVREIFHRIAEGASVRGTCRWLNDAGVRTKRGNFWAHSVLRNLLENTAYIGEYAYGKLRHRQKAELTPGGKPRAERTKRDRSQQIIIPVPPLVDPDTYRRVQERLQSTTELVRGRPTRTWPLKGCVFCGICTVRYGGQRAAQGYRSHHVKRAGYGYRRYACGSTSGVQNDPCAARWPAKDLEARALEAIRRAVEPGELGRRARALAESQRAEAFTAEEQVGVLRTEMEKLDAEELKLAELALKGFSDAIIQKKLEPIQQRRSELQVKLRAATERLSIVADPDEAERQGEAAAARIRTRLETLGDDPKELQEFFRPLIIATIWPGEQEPDVDVRVGEALRWEC